MSKSKMIALVVLITFAFGMTAVGNAVAGENYKVRTVYYSTKWEQLSVPGEEKHTLSPFLNPRESASIWKENRSSTGGLFWI